MLLNKSITLTKEQYNALVYLHKVTGKMLAQGSPQDDTPLIYTLGEVLQVCGEELMSGELIQFIQGQ